jgi:hypothetical protein
MDINKLTQEDINDYARVYLWADDINVAYPEAWALPQDRYEHDHHLCGCGCGDSPSGYNHYLPGHDQKHYGKLVRRWQAADLADQIALVHEARSTTTDGVWSKFMDRTGFDIIRGGVAMSDMNIAKSYVIHHSKKMVIKVGRWVYPVVASVEGRTFYRSTTPIKDNFQAGHDFSIEVTHDQGITTLVQMAIAQTVEGMGVTA